jgi:hypothetical protein
MVSVTVTPASGGDTVTATGFAQEDLTDVTDANFVQRALDAGLLDELRLVDRPCILDYDDADPTGANSSHAAFLEMAEDCATEGLTATVTTGTWVLDGDESATLRNGAGFSGVTWGGNTNGFDSGRRGVIFEIPYSGNRLVPPIAAQRGALLENVQFIYPDVVARLDSEAYSIDATSYPTITGAPEVYAPAIVTQHRYNDDGTASAGENVGGVILRNIGMIGAYDGIFAGDADVALETWAAAYSSGTGKGIPGIIIDRFYGYVLRRNLVLQRANNGVFCRNFHFTPGMWTEAGQAADVGGISGNDHPLIKWAQQHNVVVTGNRKVLASFDGLYARCGRKVFELEALQSVTALDGPTGQDSGKFRILTRDVRIERYPTYLHQKSTAYQHRGIHGGTGHFMDYDDDACVEPVINIETVKTAAGSIDKDTGTFKPQGNYSGWRNDFSGLEVVEAAGPVFRNTANDGCNYWTVPSNMARWGQGSKLTLSAIENLSAVSEIRHSGGLVQAADNASKRVYDVVDVTVGSGQKLLPRDVDFRGCNKLVQLSGVEQVGWAGFTPGCTDEATLNTADEADDDDDGNPGFLGDQE